jgi:simple sugar transport system ATP-binding protein
MIGADLPQYSVRPHQPGKVRLDVRDFSLEAPQPFGTALHAINLQVHGGEIVGIAGVSGNGQRELLAALSGEIRVPHRGSIHLDGRRVDSENSARRRELGLGFVPEERLGRGAVPSMSMTDNSLLTGARVGMVRGGFIRRNVAAAAARSVIAEFGIKADEFSLAERVSGGNLQKFIVGREIRLAPKVLLAAQPTWGVDIAAAQTIHRALVALRDAGAAILMVSEDLDELFTLCDRIGVIANGRLSAVHSRSQLSVEIVGTLMAGVTEAVRHA